jgi:hypothetical protein
MIYTMQIKLIHVHKDKHVLIVLPKFDHHGHDRMVVELTIKYQNWNQYE